MSFNQRFVFQASGDIFGDGLDYIQHKNRVDSENQTRERRKETLTLLNNTINQLEKVAEDTGVPLEAQSPLTQEQVAKIFGSKVISLARSVTVSIEEVLDRGSLLKFNLTTRLHERLANKLLFLANSRIRNTQGSSKCFKETFNRLAIREMFIQ